MFKSREVELREKNTPKEKEGFLYNPKGNKWGLTKKGISYAIKKNEVLKF